MSLPTGTVTFLFTDIEGSTRLWEQHPDAMRIALTRHDMLLREAIERHRGHVFKTMGDAFCSVFTSAEDAVRAALAAQQAITGQEWGEVGAIRVRMALHTGTADERDGDYFGPALNRVARLLGVGHGGQVLLSSATGELAQGRLPHDASLRDMGSHRLKDLQQPEHIHRLDHPDLPGDFPPLRSLQAFANNLPVQVSSFIGRDREMQEVHRLLKTTRLLTLIGSGGVGKTRLALQVAADLLEAYPDGVWLVELAVMSDTGLVSQAVASALGVREEAGNPLARTLADFLRPRKTLLILDNCEHLLGECSHLADSLLIACPDLSILASSRAGLGIAGEITYRVPSLALPPAAEPRSMSLSVESLTGYASVRLFADRALAVAPAFRVTPGNASAVAQVCHRLDGIPLALELAAARVRAMPVEQIASRLDKSFRLLTGGSRTALPRQQTLRALIDWSYDLLTEQERVLLRRLSVFAGGWSLEAAEQVCSGEDIEDWEVLDLLTGLVDKSLAVYAEEEGQGRYRLLETVRQYAGERLAESGEGARVGERHRDCFLVLAEETEPKLRSGERIACLDRLERERDNLRAAFEWSQAAGDERMAQMAGALCWLWLSRGHVYEGRTQAEESLKWAPGRAATRAKALWAAGSLAWVQGDYMVARVRLEESVGIWRELGDKEDLGCALRELGNVLMDQGEPAKEQVFHAESVELFRETGSKWNLALALASMGYGVTDQGDYEAAHLLLEESLAIIRALRDNWLLTVTLVGLGVLAYRQGDYMTARLNFEKSLAIRREEIDPWNIADALNLLGEVVERQGEWGRAGVLYQECLALDHQVGDKGHMALVLHNLGRIAHLQGQPGRAISLFAAAGDLRAATSGMARNTLISPADRKGDIAAACDALGREAFATAWDEGQAMSLEEAVRYALEVASAERNENESCHP